MKKTTFFKGKKSYFPHISRLFSVRPLFFIFSGLIFGILATILWWIQPKKISAISFRDLTKFTLSKRDDQLKPAYEEWKRIIEKRPDYRDGYVMLAWYARQLGHQEEAKGYIQKIQALDPNYDIPEILSIEVKN